MRPGAPTPTNRQRASTWPQACPGSCPLTPSPAQVPDLWASPLSPVTNSLEQLRASRRLGASRMSPLHPGYVRTPGPTGGVGLGGLVPSHPHVADKIPTPLCFLCRNVGASRTGNRWLRTAPCGKRSAPTTPTLHFLHRVHPSRRVPPSSGLSPGLRRTPAIQFWLRASTSPTRSVCPSRGSPSTGYSRGSASGLPTTSFSSRPGHEQTTDSPA